MWKWCPTMKLFGLDLEPSRRVLEQLFSWLPWLLRASLQDEEAPLLISKGVVKQLGTVIDVAEKSFETSKTPWFLLKWSLVI